MWATSFLLIVILPQALKAETPDFSHDNIGVLFVPYTRNSTDYEYCTMEEMTIMLKVISTRFRKVFTTGSGTDQKFGSWRYGNCPMLTGYAAALINNHTGTLKLQVSMGVSVVGEYKDKELQNTLEAAKAANHIFPGTVAGVTFWPSGYAQLELINNLGIVDLVKGAGLEIGYVENCTTLAKATRAFELLQLLDSVLCLHNGNETENPNLEVESTFRYFKNSNSTVHRIASTKTKVIGVTIRESNGKGDSNDMATYWEELAKLAKRENLMTVVGYAMTYPRGPEEFRKSGWWSQVKFEIKDESAFVETRSLGSAGIKVINQSRADLWKPDVANLKNTSFQNANFGVYLLPHLTINSHDLIYLTSVLELASTRFSQFIATPTMDTPTEGRANLLWDFAHAASLINNRAGKHKLQIILLVDSLNLNKDKALQATAANQYYPGTVARIAVWWPHRWSPAAEEHIRENIASEEKHEGIKFGGALQDCENFLNDSRTQFFFRQLDFLLCQVHNHTVGEPWADSQKAGSYIEDLSEYIRGISGDIELSWIVYSGYGNTQRETQKKVQFWKELRLLAEIIDVEILAMDIFDDSNGLDMDWVNTFIGMFPHMGHNGSLLDRIDNPELNPLGEDTIGNFPEFEDSGSSLDKIENTDFKSDYFCVQVSMDSLIPIGTKVQGMEQLNETLEMISDVFGCIVTNGIFKDSSIRHPDHLLAMAAASVNRHHGYGKIRLHIAIGIRHADEFRGGDGEPLYAYAAEQAVYTAQEANRIFNRTVSSFLFTNLIANWSRPFQVRKALEILRQSQIFPIKVGLQIEECEEFPKQLRAGEVMQFLDYVSCHGIVHQYRANRSHIHGKAREVMGRFMLAQHMVRIKAPWLEVVGRTGISKNSGDNMNATMAYWMYMNNLATQNKLVVVLKHAVEHYTAEDGFLYAGWWINTNRNGGGRQHFIPGIHCNQQCIKGFNTR